MGTLEIDLFSTLDGIAQAPGGPEEDPSGGFAFGGWQTSLIDEVRLRYARIGGTPAVGTTGT